MGTGESLSGEHVLRFLKHNGTFSAGSQGEPPQRGLARSETPPKSSISAELQQISSSLQSFIRMYPNFCRYEIPAHWQSAMTSTLKLGHMIGIFLDGYFSEVIGRKRVSLVTLVALAGIIFMQFFARSLPVFMMGRFIAGIPLGVFQAAANTYAAEVCPSFLRAYLTTYVCVCWIQVSLQPPQPIPLTFAT